MTSLWDEIVTGSKPARPAGYEQASPKLHATFGIAAPPQSTSSRDAPFKLPTASDLGIPYAPSAPDILTHALKAHGLALVFEVIVHAQMPDDKHVRKMATEVAKRSADVWRQAEAWAETGHPGDFWNMDQWASFRAAQLGDRLNAAPASVRVVYELMDGAKLDLHEAASLVDDAVQRKRCGY